MANKATSTEGMSLPIIGMLVMGIGGAVVVSLQCEVIKYWPQPPSVAPYFGWDVGLIWGLVAGACFGPLIGFIADEKNYPDMATTSYEPRKVEQPAPEAAGH